MLCIFLYSDGIVVISNEMFFCLRSDWSCSQNNQGFRMVLVDLAIDSDRAKFAIVTFGIRALVYKAREQDTLEPYERIHQRLD